MAETDVALLAAKLVNEMREAGNASSQPDLNRFAAQISNRFKARKDDSPSCVSLLTPGC